MRDKKRSFENKIQINSNINPIVTMEFGEIFFEIGVHLTYDVAEGVVLLMKANNVSDDIWDIKLNKDTFVDPIKALYWITGGDDIWGNGKNRIGGWGICGSIFADEFGDEIDAIVANSKTLGDIRDGIKEHLMIITQDVEQYYRYDI